MNIENKVLAEIPEAGEGKRGERGYLAYLLRQASGAVRAAMENALADLEVTQPQFLVMTMINAYPGISGAEIARLALLTPQTISLIIANLERDGRLTRAISPDHGRVQILQLTAIGEDLLTRSRERARKVDALIRKDLSPEEEQFLRHWLVTLATRNLSLD
jgi:DNA-binding MarR family transcriptional regulator